MAYYTITNICQRGGALKTLSSKLHKGVGVCR